MARRSNLPNLVRDAFEHGEVQASGRNWIATRVDEADRSPFRVSVQHHGTHMFNVTRAGVVEPVDRGHGSQSDMCGVRAITKGYGCGGPQGLGYREVYDDEPMNRLSGDQWRGDIQRNTDLHAALPTDQHRERARPIRPTRNDGEYWPDASSSPDYQNPEVIDEHERWLAEHDKWQADRDARPGGGRERQHPPAAEPRGLRDLREERE